MHCTQLKKTFTTVSEFNTRTHKHTHSLSSAPNILQKLLPSKNQYSQIPSACLFAWFQFLEDGLTLSFSFCLLLLNISPDQTKTELTKVPQNSTTYRTLSRTACTHLRRPPMPHKQHQLKVEDSHDGVRRGHSYPAGLTAAPRSPAGQLRATKG